MSPPATRLHSQGRGPGRAVPPARPGSSLSPIASRSTPQSRPKWCESPVLDPRNQAYQDSLVRPEHHALGATIDLERPLTRSGGGLLGRSYRLSRLDPAVFLDTKSPTDEYVARSESQLDSDTT